MPALQANLKYTSKLLRSFCSLTNGQEDLRPQIIEASLFHDDYEYRKNIVYIHNLALSFYELT